MFRMTLSRVSLACFIACVAGCGGGGGGSTGTGSVGDGGTTNQGTGSPAPAPSSDTLVTVVPAPSYEGGTAPQEKIDVFNTLNADRARCGFGKLAQSPSLDVAAQSHANYVALHPGATHSETEGLAGFTGATPAARVSAAGYSAMDVAESFGSSVYGTFFTAPSVVVPYSPSPVSAVNTLRILYSSVYHMASLMRPQKEVGLGIAVRDNSTVADTAYVKTLVVETATPVGGAHQEIAGDAVVTFPCDGTNNVNPYFLGEQPDPFPGVNRDLTPYGQPIYLRSAPGTTLRVASVVIARSGSLLSVPVAVLTSNNDVNHMLEDNQVFVVPTVNLEDNSTYTVNISGTNTGLVSVANPTGAFSKAFSFRTATYATSE